MVKRVNSDIKSPYEKWLGNEEVREKLKLMIEKVGYPLEVAAHHIFYKKKYYDFLGRYYSEIDKADGQEIWKEIDIQCEKPGYNFKVFDCEVDINIDVVADCKYSSSNDYFVFESDKGSFYKSFPVLFDGYSLFPYSVDGTFNECFKFPSMIQNIAEIDVNELNFQTTDKTIFYGANQITNALPFFARQISDLLAENILDYERSTKVITKYKKAAESWKSNVSTSMDKRLQLRRKAAEELLPQVEGYSIHCWIPLLILGKNNGIIRVKMDTERVTDFSDIGYGIYFFRPTRMTKFLNQRAFSEDGALPIIICNIKHLEACIDMIEIGLKNVTEYVHKAVQNDPALILDEMTLQLNRYQRRAQDT